MLAYAFWHWKRPEVTSESYQASQRAFQAALAAHSPIGFVCGTTVRLRGAPWAAEGGEAYEDWYLVHGMADLERLNEAAVTATRQLPHDAVARLAAGGIAGVYGLKAGKPLPSPRASVWFSKPAGMSYSGIFDALAPVVLATGAALWMRQMVLGPTPEFCIQSPAPLDLPAPFAGMAMLLEPVFPPRS